jgi:hypothetical protein
LCLAGAGSVAASSSGHGGPNTLISVREATRAGLADVTRINRSELAVDALHLIEKGGCGCCVVLSPELDVVFVLGFLLVECRQGGT